MKDNGTKHDAPEQMPYDRKLPLVTNLFKNRIRTAIKFAELKDDSVILDVGSREGHLLKSIRNVNILCKCYGIETDPHVLTKIKTCDIRLADARQMPFEKEFFNLVFVLDVLEHIEELEKTINEIKRVLKPEGFVILSGPTESWFYKFCRVLYRRMLEHEEHVHTVYDIEKKFESKSFQLVKRESLPGFPIPELFRISKFQKIT